MRKLSLLDMMVVMGAAQFDSLWVHAKLLQSRMEKGEMGEEKYLPKVKKPGRRRRRG